MQLNIFENTLDNLHLGIVNKNIPKYVKHKLDDKLEKIKFINHYCNVHFANLKFHI